LKEVYRAVDQQIAGLIDSVGGGASILVFALHGMRAASGFPAFLAPLLCERGFSRLANWSSQSWKTRALSLLATTKRHTPVALKNLYYELTPSAATYKLARPTMLSVYDWENTRAFSLPTDQYGWIRVNLVGREARGCVPQDQYEETCKQLEKMLLALTTESGQPLVEEVIRTSVNAASACGNPLPDLVVHWRDAAFMWPLKIRDSQVQVEFVGKKSTGQHTTEGFCIYRGDLDLGIDGVVAAKDLGRLMTAGL